MTLSDSELADLLTFYANTWQFHRQLTATAQNEAVRRFHSNQAQIYRELLSETDHEIRRRKSLLSAYLRGMYV